MGHIHISYTNPSVSTSLKLAKLCDYFLGLPSLFIDKDTERRKMYGKAGAIRLKNWGFEYRVLSNFWLKSQEETEWVFLQVQKIFEFLEANPDFDFADGEEVVQAINNFDKELASTLMVKYSAFYVPLKTEQYV